MEWLRYPHLPLVTDFYQLTMAQSYWKSGLANKQAVFQLFFRRAPFCGRFAIACGLEPALNFIQNFSFNAQDIAFLSTLRDVRGELLFEAEFLSVLSSMKMLCDVDAVREGTVMFANEPLLRVTGPIWQAQLLETALLNIINFQTLIATKAARIKQAAGDDEVIEFGLRRAQGFDGGVSASRAAFLGGCDATSHVFAAQQFEIPLRGTMAHSWVMSFDTEEQAFAAYAKAMPGNCVLLVDTYNTVDGVRNAMKVGKDLLGIRLDSGDLNELSHTARSMLNKAGFKDTQIVASGNLDETRIAALKKAGAPIDVWGAGTCLVTANDDPALGGIYKLTAVHQNGKWKRCFKLSDDSAKKTMPGVLQVRRYLNKGRFAGDFIYDVHDSVEPLRTDFMDLLEPVMRAGQCMNPPVKLLDIKKYIREQLSCLDESVKDLVTPVPYRVDLDEVLLSTRES